MKETQFDTTADTSTSITSGSSGFRGVRISKFRHVYGTASRRENCYEGIRITSSAHDSLCCAVNPKFVAVILEIAGGGAFQVLPIKWTGRVDYNFGRVSGHNGPVTDIKWNPFNDNVIASGSDDCTVKLWYVPDEGVRSSLNDWLCELVGHSRKIAYVEWHPTAENVLASAGHDHRILIWNVTTSLCLIEIDCHEDTIYSMSFNRNGSLLATTCKDKILRIINARSGEVIQAGWGHEGSKASKVVYIGDKGKLFTTGFSRSSTRQCALWNEKDLSAPISMQEIDASSGVLFPFYDVDTSMVYVAGKGDGNIRFYEITDYRSNIYYLNEFRSTAPQRGLGVMPKRGLKINQCEIFRFYKVHNTQTLVEPISFTVPRKAEIFQPDLYPPTAGPTPALTAEEWICGIDRDPVVISLKTGFVTSTNKPVQLRKILGESGDERAELITADRNNERKFRFLSEVTKPDYRELTQREDCERILREEQIRNHMNEILSQKRRTPASPRSAFSASPPSSPPIMTSASYVYANRAQLNRSAPLAQLSLSSGDEMPADDEDDEKGDPASSYSAPPRLSTKISPRRAAHLIQAIEKSGGKMPKSPATTSGSSAGGEGRKSHSSYLASTDSDGCGGLDRGYNEEDAELPSVGPPSKMQRGTSVDEAEFHHTNISPRPQQRVISHSLSTAQHPAASIRQGFKQPTSIVAPSARTMSPPSLPPQQFVGVGTGTGPGIGPMMMAPAVSALISSGGTSTHLPRFARPVATRVSSTSDDGKSEDGKPVAVTKPGRILPGPILPRETTAHVKPFLISHSTPQGQRGSKIILEHTGVQTSSSLSESPSKKDTELPRLYAQQSKQVRQLLDEIEQRDKRVLQLESDVKSLSIQIDRIERQFVEKREEADSLRYEIQWKDSRINELQAQLYRVLEERSKMVASNSGGGGKRSSKFSSDESSV